MENYFPVCRDESKVVLYCVNRGKDSCPRTCNYQGRNARLMIRNVEKDGLGKLILDFKAK
ncbi:MAG: hypothetical protein ABIH49_01670 [archaeon]